MTVPRAMGIALQAAVLGSLLFLAIVKLLAMRANLHLFLYEGF